MVLHIHPENPPERLIRQAVEVLDAGGLIVYPTDTIYGLGCDIYHPEAITRLARIKGIDPRKHHFSIVCYDLSNLSEYAKQLPTPVFRSLKEYLPGPYTFILPASKQVPKLLQSRKSTIGLRIPDHPITLALVKTLGHPIISTSLPGEQVEEYTDPESIAAIFEKQVDLIIDGGPGGMQPSTIIDYTGTEPALVRQGKGEWD